MEKPVLMNFKISAELRERVREKVKADRVNLSALLRGVLEDWVEGRYDPRGNAWVEQMIAAIERDAATEEN